MIFIPHTQIEIPENVKSLMTFLWGLGFRHSCLFGGALRDIDRGVRPTDYDVRVWVQNLSMVSGALNASLQFLDGPWNRVMTNGKERFLFRYKGMDIDLSPRVVTREFVSIEEVAKDRIADADATCSQIAMDPFYGVYATPGYFQCKDGKIFLRVPKTPLEVARLSAYSTKVRSKFPKHTLDYNDDFFS